ncbi:STAS domain-containing protein [Pseudalkalibacillus hwajinpoensis]|uniref:STAS domain-containing protein n=1 Tax=Guptibacillus hwajinpoensis TaxID=208199 RepID=A0A4U1MHT5_9BACL|nr:STAS domain-containing protein [Pseudalkalibacillus hwajinpoensis]TKD70006.1 STAS domain-containing protein [Pseudalkalibacillus hwajinpoensis]
MEDTLFEIGNKIVTDRYTLGKSIFALQDESYGKKLKLSRVKEDQILDWRAELLEYIGKAIYQNDEEIKIDIRNWANATGHLAISNGIPLEESFRVLTLFRRVSFEAALREIQLKSHTAFSMNVSKRIDSIIEEVTFTYNDICIEYHSQHQVKDLITDDQLHITIIPITDTLALLPITGSIHVKHADLIVKETLNQCYDKQLSDILIDLSGVSHLDLPSVNSLIRMKKVLTYSGISMCICGIQPSTALSMVTKGINLNELTIFSTLRQALLQRGIRQTVAR